MFFHPLKAHPFVKKKKRILVMYARQSYSYVLCSIIYNTSTTQYLILIFFKVTKYAEQILFLARNR